MIMIGPMYAPLHIQISRQIPLFRYTFTIPKRALMEVYW